MFLMFNFIAASSGGPPPSQKQVFKYLDAFHMISKNVQDTRYSRDCKSSVLKTCTLELVTSNQTNSVHSIYLTNVQASSDIVLYDQLPSLFSMINKVLGNAINKVSIGPQISYSLMFRLRFFKTKWLQIVLKLLFG